MSKVSFAPMRYALLPQHQSVIRNLIMVVMMNIMMTVLMMMVVMVLMMMLMLIMMSPMVKEEECQFSTNNSIET